MATSCPTPGSQWLQNLYKKVDAWALRLCDMRLWVHGTEQVVASSSHLSEPTQSCLLLDSEASWQNWGEAEISANAESFQ